MARRQLIQRKPRKARVTKSEEYIVNLKYLGDEPTLKDSYTQGDYIRVLNWYNVMTPVDDAREYLATYLKSQNKVAVAKQLGKVPDSYFPRTAAWVARMLTRGIKVKQESVQYMNTAIDSALQNVVEPKANRAAKVAQPSVRDLMIAKSKQLFEDIDGFIDDYGFTVTDASFSVFDYLQKNNIPAKYSSVLIDRYAPYLEEIVTAVQKTDPEVVESYSGISKKEMMYRVNFFTTLIQDLERYGSVTKTIRKQRKPRTISVDKKLKHFKYMKEDQNFKIASINPEKIIGAQELWCFNSTSKTLTVLRAQDRAGLNIKRSSIVGFDPNTSVTMRTGRKTEEIINSCLNGGKIVLRKLMDQLKKPAKLQERITDKTVLIRVVKE